MRSISLRDILKIHPEMQGMSEFEAIHPDNDELMADALSQIGFDINEGISYEPSKHRDMFGDVAVGYRIVGTINQDREFLNSKCCDMIERIVAAGLRDGGKDSELLYQLSRLAGTGSAITALCQDEDLGDVRDEVLMIEWGYEEDYEVVKSWIESLIIARDNIRGDMYNEWGKVKRLGEQ